MGMAATLVNHFSNLLFPQPKEAPHEISAKLAKRFQRRSRLKFSTAGPYKCMVPMQMHREANLTSPLKGLMSMYNNYFRNFGRPLVPGDLCKDSAPRHSRFWRRFLKVFYHIWAWRPSWSTDHDHFSNLSFPQPKEAPHEFEQRGQEASEEKSFEILNSFLIQVYGATRETNLTLP